VRARLSRLVRRSDLARTLLDQYPVPIRHLAGAALTGSRRISKLFRLWAGDALMLAESLQSLDAYHGGDVLDVGAFHGWYALLLAPRARPGDCFVEVEPDKRAFPELLSNMEAIARWYPDVRLCTMPVAVGNGKPVRVEWPMGPEGHPTFSSDAATGGEPTLTLDALCLAMGLRPTFVKIDVEGAEAYVLEGMDQLLDRHRPVVMLEIHPQWQPRPYSVDWLMERMKRHGYQARELAEQPLARRVLFTGR
jgi:FkbM family methyltransferase